MTLREATVADAAGIAFVHVESWRTTYPGIMPQEHLDALSVAERTEVWQGILQNGADGSCTFVAQVEKRDPEIPTVFLDGRHHFLSQAVGERTGLAEGRNDVVDRRQSTLGVHDFQPPVAQHLKRLRAGHFMNQVLADEQLRLP